MRLRILAPLLALASLVGPGVSTGPAAVPSSVPGAPDTARATKVGPAGGEPTYAQYRAWRYAWPDCNGNCVRDSIDIAEGTEPDVNKNGEIDFCDADTLVRNAIFDTSWHAAAYRADTSYFLVCNASEHRTAIRYTIPRGGAAMRLAVLDSAGTLVCALRNGWAHAGAYDLYWTKSDATGMRVRPGRYWVRLTVGRREYARPVHWACTDE